MEFYIYSLILVNTCAIVACRTGYKKKKKEEKSDKEKFAVFGFPEREELKNVWIRFVVRKDS